MNADKKFKEDIQYRLKRLKFLADKHGWKLLNETPSVLFFESFHNWGYVTKSFVQMKISYHEWKIETTLNHPKNGVTALVREGEFNMNLIEKIFCNPRTHMPTHISGKYIK